MNADYVNAIINRLQWDIESSHGCQRTSRKIATDAKRRAGILHGRTRTPLLRCVPLTVVSETYDTIGFTFLPFGVDGNAVLR